VGGTTASGVPPLVERLETGETGSPLVDEFSLVQGGLIYRFQTAIGMALPNRAGVLKRALLTTLVTWFPMLILSLIQGLAFGPRVNIPFLYDFAAGIRFLIGLPLLVIAEAVIDPRLNHAVRHFVKSGLVAREDLPAFEQVLLRVNRLRNAIFPGIAILAIAFAPSIFFKKAELLRHGFSSWHTITSASGESLSLAGWWFALISVPLFRLLLLRWVWIIFLWTVFLSRVRRIRLGCVATHPDTCGGLGFLAHAQLLFGFIAFAGSAAVAGALGNQIAYEGSTVSSVKFLMITYCVLMTVLLAAPLLVLTPKLAELKRSGLHKYAGLGTAYVKSFDAKWIRRLSPEQEPLLGTADIQSLADLYNSYTVVREMNVVLVDKKVHHWPHDSLRSAIYSVVDHRYASQHSDSWCHEAAGVRPKANLDAVLASHAVLTAAHIIPAAIFVLLAPGVLLRRTDDERLERFFFPSGFITGATAYLMSACAVGGWVERSAVLVFNTWVPIFAAPCPPLLPARARQRAEARLDRARGRHPAGYRNHASRDGSALRHEFAHAFVSARILRDRVLDRFLDQSPPDRTWLRSRRRAQLYEPSTRSGRVRAAQSVDRLNARTDSTPRNLVSGLVLYGNRRNFDSRPADQTRNLYGDPRRLGVRHELFVDLVHLWNIG
jgi:hypothetical protein